MPFPERMPSRRAVVVGMTSAAGLTLAGCTSDGDLPDLPGLSAPTEDADPDLALVRRVQADELGAMRLVQRTRARHPELRARLADTLRFHQSHLEVLGDAATGTDRARRREESAVAAQPARALADVVAAERRLAVRHSRSALEARSGPLARTVASMAAAAAQQGSVLGSAADRSGA